MIEAALVFASILMLLWVLWRLDRARRRGESPQLGLLSFRDESSAGSGDRGVPDA